MNVREAIEKLAAVAAQLPEGLETEFKVGFCDGRGILHTADVEIDYWSVVRSGEATASVVHVGAQGHPHRDPEARYMPGATEDPDYRPGWVKDD